LLWTRWRCACVLFFIFFFKCSDIFETFTCSWT
jgi:hypothetical protein